MTRCLLAEDFDKTVYEIDVPLTSLIDFRQIRSDLGVPQYVDSDNFLLERGLVTIWAAMKVQSLKESNEHLEVGKGPIPVLLFGGAAVKMLCPMANDPHSPLCREIGDIDLLTSKKRGQDFYKLLLALSGLCGTRYYHFATRSDRRFNAMRSGKRFRVRAIDKIADDSLKTGILDIFTDEISLRHKVDLRAALENPEQNAHTIGPEALLLTKCQYIFDVHESECDESQRQEIEYRILDYAPYKHDRLLIGIEDKDVRDVCSILLSHDFDQRGSSIQTAIFGSALKRDKGFALTFKLNFERLAKNEAYLKHIGLPNRDVETILSRAGRVLDAIPPVDKKWSSPWWNVDVETPKIFAKNHAVDMRAIQ